jgi:membrane protease YdiL (CAAX protease family)
MTGDKSVFSAVTRASFLLGLVLILLFLYAQSFTPSWVFPKNTTVWNQILTGYLIFFAITLITLSIIKREIVLKLASANYWKSFTLRFIPSALVTSIILILIKGLLKSTESIDLFTAIAYMPLSVLLVHLFVVSQVEELLFAGLIFGTIADKFGETSANIITMVLFGVWHLAKTGGNIIAMAVYMPLRYWWNFLSRHGTPYLNRWPRFFGPTPSTQQANAGSHFAWNLFVIGFIEPFRI